MILLYLFLILFGLLLAYRVFKLIKKRRRISPKHPLVKAIRVMYEIANDQVAVNGKVHWGYGEFGYVPTNPIPVRGIMGAAAYISRLRTNEGSPVEYERIGQAMALNINNPVDMYLINVNGEFHCKLFFCAYFKTMSNVAPEGFRFECKN